MKSPIRLALAIAVASVFSPAMAQEVIGTLNIQQGTVMTSTGGEFVSAATGEAIQVGEQIMVSEGGSASVTFSNGVVSNLTTGVHTISGMPAAAGAAGGATAGSVGTAGGASMAATAGVIAGTAAAVAAGAEAADDGDNETPDQPVSR